MSTKIGIIGGGVWGSALAKLLDHNDVLIYSRDEKVITSINNLKINPKLKYVVFKENVRATSDLSELKKCEYLFFALPTQNIKEVCEKYGKSLKNQRIIIGSKGIDVKNKLFPSEIISQILSTKNISILSGPCFSSEVAQNLPTAVTLATDQQKTFDEINSLFNNNNFRLYFSDDIIGCQLGGALKNIYAIAAGITIGLNLGENAKSALISRSFSEIIRFAKAYGANSNTLFGLSGLGDLILTCNSLKSRNTSFGQLIASQPKTSVSDHLKTRETTEGYYTVRALIDISKEMKIDMPIAQAIYNILFNKAAIKDQITELLKRPLVKEI